MIKIQVFSITILKYVFFNANICKAPASWSDLVLLYYATPAI